MGVGRAGVIVVALLCGLAACGSDPPIRSAVPSTSRPAAGWTALPRSPLAPRANALGVWTGDEVLVIGGDPEAWCPPMADCEGPSFVPLNDGAAFDPAKWSWRRIADAPVGLSSNASAVTVGDVVYVLVHDVDDGRFLRYVPGDDRWEQLPLPAPDAGWYRLATAAGQLVAYQGSAEAGHRPDVVFDPASDSWRELSTDPLAPSFDRTMVAVGDHIYLFAHDLVDNPGSEHPSLTRVARLDLGTGEWERRSDSEILGSAPWFVEDGVLVNPSVGQADGGEVNNWGRAYPMGGVYDSATDTWSALPNPPSGVDLGGEGVIGRSHATFFGADGEVLDWVTEQWESIPRLPDATEDFETSPFNRTVVSAGSDLFVFGGEVWPDNATGELLGHGYLWRN